jgi:rhodanese-related sulfurtransferase
MQSVSPAQARELIRTRKDLLVVDVRTPGELRTGVIAGSLKVPFWAVMRGQHELPRDKALLLVCAVGGRSYAASQILVRNGYPEVYNLSGGIAAWKKAGFPLTEP